MNKQEIQENPPTITENGEKRRTLSIIAELYVLFLTFLLPLKFGTLVGVPELPATYWNNFTGILIGSWPVLTFPVFAGFGLALTLLFAFPRKYANLSMIVLGVLWCLFAASSLTGIIHATTWDFYEHNVIYVFGTAAYALSLMNLFSNNRKFGKYLLGFLVAGFVLSLYSAIMQYTVGFQDLTEYYEKRKLESGGQFYFDKFGRRLAEYRISADFSSGNAYSGYLLLLFPIVLSLLCIAGGRVTPPLPAKILLMTPTAILFLFLLRQTKSRGCFLALIAGCVVTALAFRYRKKIFLAICSFFACSFAGFCLLIALDRGPESILFRLDYFKAAIRMMLDYPFAGAGWGEFFHNYFIYKDLINDEAPHTPHNFPFTVGSQCGIGAFLISSLLILIPLAVAFLLLKKQGTMQRKTQEEKEQFILSCGLLTGFAAWFFHCLCEIDFETPGSFCTAAAVAFLILNNPDMEKLFPRFSLAFLAEKKYFPKLRIIFSLFFIIFSLGLLFRISWKAPTLITAEMAFDRLFTGVNPHFGRLGEKMAQPEEAAKLLQEAVKRMPESPFPWDTASHYVAALGPAYANEAIALVVEAQKRSPKRASYYYRQSLAYRRLGDIPKAVEMLKKARQCSPKNPEYFDERQNWNTRYEDTGSLW
ncbi:MAG: O-antigen ligase family protein [Lentisphaeria bacterium]|nr:O-antigen ligase family protein [Lentisphaeria bacterium]